ncbi:MAG TPA: HNH endonuclease signature motif containing protein [Chloroflexota bacterium]
MRTSYGQGLRLDDSAGLTVFPYKIGIDMAPPAKPGRPCKQCGKPVDRYRTKSGYLMMPTVCAVCRPRWRHPSGTDHWKWNGGHSDRHKSGYVRIWNGPGKRELEHRAVWIAAYGPIPKGMQLHHCNGDKTDNRLENLALVSNKGHQVLHRHERVLNGRWSLVQKQCVACQTTERPHKARGLCSCCYSRLKAAGLL